MKQSHSKPGSHRSAADDRRLKENRPDEALRVETARHGLADPVRGAVQAALGARVRYRARVKENPVEVYLNAE